MNQGNRPLVCHYLHQPVVWSDKLSAAERFKLVLDNQAVLDKETGLVWERSLETTQVNWKQAVLECYRKTVGGRRGWRLPTIYELLSLVDPANTNPALPSGHPFLGLGYSYWTMTSCWEIEGSNKWIVNINSGQVETDSGAGEYCSTWAVRGGPGCVSL